jgi:hypothetical protein
MGHSSITVTLDRYGHLMPGSEAEAARMLDGYLQRENRAAARQTEPRVTDAVPRPKAWSLGRTPLASPAGAADDCRPSCQPQVFSPRATERRSAGAFPTLTDACAPRAGRYR